MRNESGLEIPGYDGEEIISSSGSGYKLPKPERRPKSDIKARRSRSKSQEDRVAVDYQRSGFPKAKRVFGSGAFKERVMLGDVDPGEWILAECKETRSGGLNIKREWVNQIRRESAAMNRPWWALHAWIADDTSNFEKVVILDEAHFFEILRRLRSYEET